VAGWLFGSNAALVAENYAKHVAPWFFRAWTDAALSRLRLTSGARVLDVACGTGALTRAAAARVGPTGRVVGMDASSVMLSLARRTEPAHAGARIEWLQGDVHALGLPSGAFDAVTCPHGIMFFDAPGAALREMHRVLAPGGRLVATAWGRRDRNPHEAAMADAFARHMPAEPPFFSTLFSFGEEGALEELAASVGLQGRVDRVTSAAHFPSAAAYWDGMACGRPLAEIIARLPARTVGHIRRENLARLAPYAKGSGYRAPIEAVILTMEKFA
jgi:ubiquinone/menaquinone biosynthesis C-methylase UbiE